jgi:microcystin-dependent protein
VPFRIEHVGGAAPTTLSGGVDASVLSLPLTAGTGYPTGVVGPFVLTVDEATSAEERILCSARTGNTVTVVPSIGRGWDGTTASIHGAGARVTHTFSATEADEANVAALTASGEVAARNAAIAAAVAALPVPLVLPAGLLAPYTGAAAPTGWLLCDGSTQLKATYPALSTVLGTTYGAGDATHFVLPDLRGRVAAGADNMGGSDAGRLTSANTLGTAVGEESHTLTVAETPAHAHPGSTVGANQFTSAGVGGVAGTSTGGSTFNNGIVVASQGGGSAHNNMQPTLTVNYIVKT